MATYFARKTGNINATDIWATTPSGTAGAVTFVSGDILIANSFTITVNVSTDLGTSGQVRNDTTGGATTGGSFSLSNGVTLTANVFAGSATCVTLASTASATIVGNITGGTSSNAHGASFTSSGSFAIIGSITGGSASSAYGINMAGAGTVTITGNVTGGSASITRGISISAGILVTTGNVNASAAAPGIYIGAGPVTITGTISGGTSASQPGIENATTTTVTVTGTAVGATSVGVLHSSSGPMTITRAKGGPLAASAAGVTGSTTGSTSVEEIEFGDNGAAPTNGPIRLVDQTSNVALLYRFGSTKKTLADANASGLMPAVSDVRFGTVYNGGNNIGTCRVPNPGSVSLGVLIDVSSTGTAALTPSNVWDYLTTNINTSNSIGERLKNCSTIASVGQQLSNSLG